MKKKLAVLLTVLALGMMGWQIASGNASLPALGSMLLWTLPLFGVVTVTQDWRTNDAVEYTIIATADADATTGNIAHGLGARPQVTIIPILQAPAAVSAWAATTIDVTNVVLGKGTGVGSGNAGAQVRLRVERRRG